MFFAHVRPAAACLLAAAALFGCVAIPEETWTNLGPSNLVTEAGKIVCYTDANIIDGKRIVGTLCATPRSGFLSDGEPQVLAGVNYRQPFRIDLSKATKGEQLPFGDKTGLLECEPDEADGEKSTPVKFCKVTINGQALVSAKITFAYK